MNSDTETLSPVHMVEIGHDESLALLGTVPLGRVVFSQRALPAIRPVNHVLDDRRIIIRTHDGTALLGSADMGAVVAYEADSIDTETHTGWSVIATGTASLVSNQEELERYRGLLRPWINGEMQYVIQIDPIFVTGYRLVSSPATVNSQAAARS